MTRFILVGVAALLASACAAQPVAVEPVPAVVPTAAAVEIPKSDQWLFGSAEASAATLQTFRAITAFALEAARNRPGSSVILAVGNSPFGPGLMSFMPCGAKPLAVVFDADETLIWNIPPTRRNVEHNSGKFDVAVWDSWEKTGAGFAKPIPGAVEALAAMRAAGITPVANTNRAAVSAAGTAATLKAAGLGDFVHGETLFLKGDDQEGSSKDGRRTRIADRFCVIAMAGDQLGDFSQAFNTKGRPAAVRGQAALSGPISGLWGRGWFMLPNPSYGPWETQKLDDVYGPDEWRPAPGAE